MSCLASYKPLDARIDMVIRVCLEFARVDSVFEIYKNIFVMPVFYADGRGYTIDFVDNSTFSCHMETRYRGNFTEHHGLDWEMPRGCDLDEQSLSESGSAGDISSTRAS